MEKTIRTRCLENHKGEKILYLPDCKRIFKVNESGSKFIEDLADGNSAESMKEKYSLTEEKYNNIINTLHIEKEEESCSCAPENEKILGRLVIHVTNVCNLNCSYCYANGGNYLSACGLMSEDMLEEVIRVFYAQYDRINTIQFFGGEPLLNIPVIEKACGMIREIDKERGYTTQFGLVTNGTLIDQDFIDLVKKYHIGVTISYDGNIFVNDILRADKEGKGVSELVLKNAQNLKSQTNEPNTVEVTYTQVHIENEVKILDVVKHIQEILPNTYVHLVPAGGKEEDEFTVKNLDIFADSIDEIFREADKSSDGRVPSYSLADRIFYALKNKEAKGSRYICDAGVGTISVSVGGDVYPCFMFTDQEELKLGNIMDPKLFDSAIFREQLKRIRDFSFKGKNAECEKCYINTLCNGCLGLNSYHSGDPLVLSNEICEMFRNMTDRAIINFADRVGEA